MPELSVLSDLEAAGHRTHGLDEALVEALLPATAIPQRFDVAEELLDGRVVAVAHRAGERGETLPPERLPHGEARERGRVAVPLALGAHALLADRLGPPAPGRGRIGIGAEDGDLPRLEAAVPKGRIRGEAGKAPADDRAAPAHRPAFGL